MRRSLGSRSHAFGAARPPLVPAAAALLALALCGVERAGAQSPASPQGVTRLLVSTYRVKPDRVGAWMALQKNEVVPALKKAGVKRRAVYRTVVGDTAEFQVRQPEPRDRRPSEYYSSFAPLDGEPPVAKTLGPQGTRELLAKGQGLIDPLEWIVRERVAELSF